jgi:hypothetical protein
MALICVGLINKSPKPRRPQRDFGHLSGVSVVCALPGGACFQLAIRAKLGLAPGTLLRHPQNLRRDIRKRA